jgi:hypothetical protein
MDEFEGQQLHRPLTGMEIRLVTIRHPTIERIGKEYHCRNLSVEFIFIFVFAK